MKFRDSLSKTASGEVLRRLLKARDLGLPEGDPSPLPPMEHRHERR
jgi:acyl-coenzyme A synthetase/AMP-(fatty) acid ligase